MKEKAKMQKSKRGEIEIVVAGILRRLIKGKYKVLLGRKRSGSLKGTYVLPGGHLEHGETMRDCVSREFKEEVRMFAEAATYPTATYEVIGRNMHRVVILYNMVADEVQDPKPSEELDFVAWFDDNDLHNAKANGLLAPSTISVLEAGKIV